MKLKDLIIESPDSVKINDKYYSFASPNYNICTFVIYENPITHKASYFGFSHILKSYLSNDDVAEQLTIKLNTPIGYKSTSQQNYYNMMKSNTSGGHGFLKDSLKFYFQKSNGVGQLLGEYRIFSIEGLTIVTNWDSIEQTLKYKNFVFDILKKLNINPEKCLYENHDIVDGEVDTRLTYNEFLNIGNKKHNDVETEIDKLIKRKSNEYKTKIVLFHTSKATMSDGELKRLEKECNLLDAEIKLLYSAKQNNKTNVSDVDLQLAVVKVVHNEPKDIGQLYSQLEKIYGMPIVMIKRKYSGIPLDQLLKKSIKEYINFKKQSCYDRSGSKRIY